MSIDRLTKLLRMASSPFEGEAKNAFALFHRALAASGWHANDLELILVDSRHPEADEMGSLIRDLRNASTRLRNEADALQAENAHLTGLLESNGIKLDKRAMQRDLRVEEWKEFEELVIVRVLHGKRIKDWENKICDRLDVSYEMLARWRRGTAIIPPEIMGQLRDLPGPESDIVIKEKAEQISSALVAEIAALLFAGSTKTEISKKIGSAAISDPAKAILTRKPPYELRIPVIKNREPTNWYELWEISSCLFGKNAWKTNILSRLGISYDVPFKSDVNEHADVEKLYALRQRYWAEGQWGIFVKASLDKHRAGCTNLSWWDIVSEARNNYGFSVSNTYHRHFTSRFNDEYFPIFRIRDDIDASTPAVD